MKKRIMTIISLLLITALLFSCTVIGAFAAVSEDEPAASGAVNPKFTLARPGSGCIYLMWDAIDGISLYRLYRWYDDGRGWAALKDTSGLSYTDYNVTSGCAYRYRLCGISAKGSVLTPSVSVSVTYYAPAQITLADNTPGGVRIRWNKPSGINRVAVLRRDDGEWKRIADSSDAVYTDKDVDESGEYTYTVRTLADDGSYIYDTFDDKGVTIKRLPTPEISVSNAAGGVEISWKAVSGAERYRVFVRSGGDWTAVGDTDETSYLDTGASSGKSYTYTVRCVSPDGKSYPSYFDTQGKSVNYIAAPVLKSAAAVSGGIKISWDKSEGAGLYRVFYLSSSGSWIKLGDTSSTSFTDSDVRSGSTYTYTVRCMNSSGSYISSFYSEGIRGTFLSAPVINSVSCGADGVDISWDEVKGAVNYRVYYYGSRGWTRLADTAETSITDIDVSSNHTYTYTVRCINAEGTDFTSDYLPGKSVRYIAAPAITQLKNTEDGVSISWNAVSGAEKYRVYYYGSRGWTRMADTTSTAYLDEDVASGCTYTYTVRCLNSAGTAFLSYFKPGVQQKFVAAPEISSLSWDNNSISIKWNPVSGAELYRLYLRGENGWTKILDTTETEYTDKNVVSGETYTYTVRCLNAEATAFTSDYKAGKSLKYVETPRISGVYNTTEGVGIEWPPVSGAVKYRVYYYGNRGWTKLTETTGTSVVDTDVASGSTYTYTVRCVNPAGTEFESGFDSDGASIRYIAAPKNIKADSYNNSVKISWTASAGAEKYRVYVYGDSGWKRIAETDETSAIHEDVTSGSTYRYTVRCISSDGKSFTSDFNRDGVSYKYTDVPKLGTPGYTKDGIEISWSKSPGAEKYRVYYYGSRGWTKLTETTGTSVTDTAVASGHTYRYTVRCITSDGRSFTSDCDTTGVSVYYVSAPKLMNLETTPRRVTFTWSKPSGAAKYRVYKKINGSWSRLTDTTSNTYTDTSVTIGNTYIYTVRVISSDSSEFLSGFDPTGFIVTVVSSTENFRYYDQTQYSYPYGDDTIAGSGCGPTSFAMIASTITGKTITPINAVEWCGNDYYIYNVGTMWSYFYDASERFGISLEQQLGRNEIETVIAALKQGKYVISAQSAGRFTSGGHFIVLAGIDADGRIIVYDPNGGNHYVGSSFNKEEITAAGTQYWIFDAK